jgi:serine/threonine-protein kinase RsbW
MAELELYVDLERVTLVREFVARMGSELGLEPQVMFDLQLAVEEACTNVVLHAYDGQGGNLQISFEPIEGGVRVVLRDFGAPFDPQAIPLPNVKAPLDQRPLGGLGLYLIQQVTDQVGFEFDEAQGNTLTMIKHCSTGVCNNGSGSVEGY